MSDDYDIGYRKPPREHRFRKGQSGNPKGRPKKQPPPKADNSLAGMMQRVTERKIMLHGEEITLREMELLALQTKAAKGDVAASRQLAQLRKEAGLVRGAAPVGGVLVVPAPPKPEEFEAMAYRQQARFREQPFELEPIDGDDAKDRDKYGQVAKGN
jgi:hypothetical protein